MLKRRQFLTAAAATAVAAPLPAFAAGNFVLPEIYRPQIVKARAELPAGELIVESERHFIYWLLGNGQAIRYGVGVGEAGREFKGEAVIARKAEWPRWTPTQNMIRREPEKYKKWAGGMEGGPDNPLGARALYLYQGGRDTLYRIHGTPYPSTVGRSVSSGCIRMLNAHVEDLYQRVPVGTKVTVV